MIGYTLVKLHALMTHGEVEVRMNAFLAAGVNGNGCLASSTRRNIYKMSIELEAEWASEPV
jgi:hypothetical protein